MESEEQAEQEQRNLSKVPATLGVMIGIFVVIAVIGILLVVL